MIAPKVRLERRPNESLRAFLHREHLARRQLFAPSAAPVEPPKAVVCAFIPAPTKLAPSEPTTVPADIAEAVPVVTKALADLRRFDVIDNRPRIAMVVQHVAMDFGLDPIEMLSVRRTDLLVRARQIAMYLAKVMTLRSFPEIGRRMGKRDHTTVLHGVRKIEYLIERDAELAAHVGAIKARIEEAVRNCTSDNPGEENEEGSEEVSEEARPEAVAP